MAGVGSGLRWVVLGVVIASLAGCSNDDRKTQTEESAPSSPSASADAAPAQCRQLTASQVTTLTGSKVVSGPRSADVNGLPTCQWRVENRATVQVVSQDAGRWAKVLPTVLTQLRSSGLLKDPGSARKLDQASALIKQGKSIPAKEACGLFSTMLELQGLEAGSDYVVNLIPSKEDPRAITGQACIDGRFASVLWVSESLTGSTQEVTRVQAALETVVRSG